ncbi:hypothetical protein H9X78_04230 [Clostridium saudiense]|nr:hypothetical protein [Clostridium saudiense]
MIDLVINEIKKDKSRVIDFIKSNTKPKKGIYIVVDIDNRFDDTDFNNYLIVDSSVDRFISAIVADNHSDKDELRKYIADRDRMSKVLNSDSNKAIDSPNKKILSTVYKCLTLNKKTVSIGKDSNFKTIDELMTYISEEGFVYYRNLKANIEKILRIKSNEIPHKDIADMLQYAEDEKRLSEIDAIEVYLKENLEAIIDFANNKGIPTDGVMKVFFKSSSGVIDDSEEAYSEEENLYLYKAILNADMLTVTGDTVRGTTVYGFNNNSKKTGIKPLCMNIDLVKYLTIEEAMDYRLAFQLLETISVNNSGKSFGMDTTSQEFQFATGIEDSVEEKISITDFTDNIDSKGVVFRLHYKKKFIISTSTNTFTNDTANFVANTNIHLKNYLFDDKFKFRTDFLSSDGSIIGITSPTVALLLARIGFCSRENLNLYSDYSFSGSKDSAKCYSLVSSLEFIYNKYKNLMNTFLYNSNPDKRTTYKIINDYTDDCINAYILNGHNLEYSIATLACLINYKLNLVEKFKVEGKGMILLNMATEIKEKLKKAVLEGVDFEFENEAEYFYTLGQLAFYVEYQVKKKLDLSPFKEYTNKRSAKDMVNHLITRMDLYGYSINPCNNAFRTVASKVLLTGEISGKVKDYLTFFYGGVASDNIFLTKHISEVNGDTEKKI